MVTRKDINKERVTWIICLNYSFGKKHADYEDCCMCCRRVGNQMFHAAYALALRTKGGNADLNDFLAAHGQSHYGSELMDVFHVK